MAVVLSSSRMRCRTVWGRAGPLWLLLLLLVAAAYVEAQDQDQAQGQDLQAAVERMSRCVNEITGLPQRCIPPFENAATKKLLEATNTCGQGRQYCPQLGQTGSSLGRCETCYDGQFGPQHLTDEPKDTWWQSDTLFHGQTQINLTLNLGKLFDITYVRLVFHSPRPQSFAIYKRTTENGPWIPYQYYSATCRDSYGLPESIHAPREEETRALCTSEYSDISPLTGGTPVFSTLEGRPSAYHFDSSAELQDWVAATDIRITLDRMNTFGDEYFGDEHVLQSYYYAISDLAVGARCACNGHASECESIGSQPPVCKCQHNTDGRDCERCLPFYNDQPWARATFRDANVCKQCDCSGFSERCFYDKDLYEETGHGGHCVDCRGNRAGPHCERCKENFYAREDGVCIDCYCSEMGSRSLQCNDMGQCLCKPGVTGEKCDRCEANHFDFSSQGCTPCNCNEAGSKNNTPTCDAVTGKCECKEHVEGKRCGVCKPGYFNLDQENDFGCTPCFCNKQSSECQSAPGYSKVTIESSFARGSEKWTAEDSNGTPVQIHFNGVTQTIRVSAAPDQDQTFIYFNAPDKFLGDQRSSYNQDLSFRLRIDDSGASPTLQDVVLKGAGYTISQTIYGHGNKLPSVTDHDYVFRLHENQDYGWQPTLQALELIAMLSNLTAIKIRGTYTPQGEGILDDFRLSGARRGAAGQPARWIEMCKCPEGYVGQFCESCAPGYRHEPTHGGPDAKCVPCNCNGHADICDADTGRCICHHNTAGDNCDRCAKGFYGNALMQTENDCKPCPCPGGGACLQIPDETVVCLECTKGHAGPKCDRCSDGYYGDPVGLYGPVAICQPCDCNDNIDPNAVGNCNRTSGECLKCIYNTGGFDCAQCLPGYYGDPLSLTKGNCKQCRCDRYGTNESDSGPFICDQFTGQCPCKSHVMGINCDTCEPGFYDIISGEGCQACNCDPTGSVNHTCNVRTGQCHCREGITGLHCDQCLPYHYGFSTEGCKPCDCDKNGSTNEQCDPSGQCPCQANVEGRRCDRCKENKYDRQHGCLNCPDCYNLVEDAVRAHRGKLNDLRRILKDIANNPTTANDDADFERRLEEVQRNVNKLNEDAKNGAGGDDKTLTQKIEDIYTQLESVGGLTKQVKKWTQQAAIATDLGEKNVSMAEQTIERVQNNLQKSMEYLETAGKDAFQKALNRSNEFGQRSNQMSAIAREARMKAEDQEKEVEKIKKVAEDARNVSSKAFGLAESAVKQQQNASVELRRLGGEIFQLGQKLEGIRAFAHSTSGRVNATHEGTLSVYRDISSLILPDINVPKLKEDAYIAKGEAEKMKEDAENLVNSHTDLLKDLSKQMQQSEELLQTGEQQRQKATDLLAQVDAAHARATTAVASGDKILKEAQDTYATLQKFDKQVQESKVEAPDALSQRPKIVKLIQEARDKTADAQRALAGAKTNSQNARDTAQNAQMGYAEQASKEADKIRQGAGETKEEAKKLRDEADLLTDRVATTGLEVAALEDQATSDEFLTSNAKKNVGQAKTEVTDASKQVQKALEEVDAIIKELSEYSENNEDNLDLPELESRLEKAKEQFRNAELDKEIEDLTLTKQTQMQLLKSYQDDIEYLIAEVNNIDDIQAALPSKCFRQQTLEP